MDQQTGQRSLIRTPLSNAPELTIEEFDHVTLFGQDSLLVPDSVSVFGNVLEPGRYLYHHQMNAEDLILQAGGFRRGAIPWEVEVVKPVFDLPGILSQSTSVSLSNTLPYPDSSVTWPEGSDLPEIDAIDFPLGPDYEVYVRRLPTFQDVRHVTINGEVPRPGIYVLQSVDEKLSSVINRAGGLTESAYPEGGRVTRLGTPVGANFVGALSGDLQEDIVLADEDIILIPVYNPTILVQGAVAFESRMRYRIGMDLDEVIANAGGYIYDADPRRISVEYLNGERATVKSTLWIFKSIPDIEPGSRITVPLKSTSPRAGFNWNNALSATLATLSAFATVYLAVMR
jgi:protein involved in polysaccharide export with SLBB domain